ncbi:MAG: hydrogenase expression/formation protein HypE, partial [Candidatus Brockarchaeota archaeon]|nr:hydrogenase expression/formation protein HypE [Candidatus Brockarchaeota archaeon]
LVAFVSSEDAPKVLEAMRGHEYGADSQLIGEVTEGPRGTVVMKTKIGGERIVDMLVGEQLPRIC